MRSLVFILLTTIQVSIAQHSIFSSSVSAYSRGLANSGICDWTPANGFMNTGHLAFIPQHAIGLETYNYFFIPDLYNLSAHAAMHLDGNSGLGITLISDGSSDLRDWLLSASYGRKLTENTGIGIAIDYLRTQTPESHDLQSFSFELGMQTKLLPSLLIGFVMKNPIPIKTSDLYPYPAVFKAGINYKVYEQLQVLVEAHKYGTQNTSFHFGIDYRPIQAFRFTTGVNTAGPLLSLGIQYKLESNITLSTSFQQHPVLGTSPSFGFNYSFR